MNGAQGGKGAAQGRAVLGLAVAVTCSAVDVSSAEVDGVYKLSQDSDCAAIGQEGGAIRVQDRVLYGIEAQCRMLNPVPVRNMDAELVDMMCAGGGTEWTERAIVMRGAQQELILVWNGYAFAYPRCPNTAPMVTDASRPHRRPVTSLKDLRPKARPLAGSDGG